ncbi:MAG: hypothetical protein ABI895_40320, partial [Deltaproteobacteria bacterium]
MKRSPIFWFALACIGVGTPVPAQAEILICCGDYTKAAKIVNPTNVQFFYDTADFPVGNSWTNRLITAAQGWTDIPESNLAFNLFPKSGAVGFLNLVNEIWWEAGGTQSEAARAFRTYSFGENCEITPLWWTPRKGLLSSE